MMRCLSTQDTDLAAWTPPVQPVSHPNDEDLSLGTPVWRPALLPLLRAALGLAAVAGAAVACCGQTADGGTRLRVTSQVILSGVTRLGMNLGEQNFYDSGQMLRNLLARNPEFAGMTYRSIFHCVLAARAGASMIDPASSFRRISGKERATKFWKARRWANAAR